MNVFKLSQRGEAHPNHNQDYAISHTIGDQHLLIAVLDGCSSGIDSYFAATLMGKLLRKAAIQLDHLAFVEKRLPSSLSLLHRSTQLLFSELGQLGRQLHLRREEMLSTALIAVVDRNQRAAELLAVGDGLIAYNRQLIPLEQGTAPDYLAYHFDEAFQDWFDQQRHIQLSNIQDLSICTDGIFS
ncbi:MAG: protein phosphatase 2C domain-containing protein, partial [Bacteroidota bacterium]